jgi:hypothetical protein
MVKYYIEVIRLFENILHYNLYYICLSNMFQFLKYKTFCTYTQTQTFVRILF